MPGPVKNIAYSFYIALGDSATAGAFVSNPTLATGDFKVSTDGGALGNLTTLPVVTPASSVAVLVALSAAEMNGDTVVVVGIDAAGAEWDDIVIYIEPESASLTDIDADVTAVLADTGELQTDWVDGGRLDLILDARASQTTADAIETDTQDIQGRIPAALVSGKMNSDAVAISGSTAAADAVEANIANLDAAISNVEADTQDIQGRIPATLLGGRMDSDVEAINASTNAADNLSRAASGITLGTVGAGSSTTSIVTSSLDPAAAVANQFKSGVVLFDRATTTTNLQGVRSDITASSAGGVLTVTALPDTPVSGDTFVIL